MFKTYTVLFIGYGLSEFELLEFIIPKSDNTNSKKKYILEGYFTGEENIVNYETKYYEALGIELIPYSKDDKGYDQLFEIIQAWAVKIQHKSNNQPELLDKNQ